MEASNNQEIQKIQGIDIRKVWGKEVVLYQGKDYTVKKLIFNYGCSSSSHFHRLKHEHFLVLEGKFILDYFNHKTGEAKKMCLKTEDFVDIPIGCVHKIHCIEVGTILETSTEDFLNDSYRLDASSSLTN
tara:strand:+ start:14063 stop:14452 length:390 start_codon:yes stop_codon:yes gene_type:complete